jgi:hypothetical protein
VLLPPASSSWIAATSRPTSRSLSSDGNKCEQRGVKRRVGWGRRGAMRARGCACRVPGDANRPTPRQAQHHHHHAP